jgi:DNA-directed RNA polymerase subunit K/omega
MDRAASAEATDAAPAFKAAAAKVPNDYTLRLTKYERVHVVGMRAEQLARGMQAFVPLPEPVRGASANDLFYDIAERELDQNKLPFIVVRQLLDGTSMHIRTSDPSAVSAASAASAVSAASP